MVSVTLLLYGGAKIPIEVDENVLSKVDFTDSAENFTVNDLVDYLFTYWNEIFADAGVESPVYISQIQLIHLGVRLQPGTKLGSLNLAVSPIFHLIIKPVDMVRAYSDSNNVSRKGIIQKLIGNSAIGKTKGTNSEPVYTKRTQDNSAAPTLDGRSSRKDGANDDSVDDEEISANQPNTQAEIDTSSTEGHGTHQDLQENIALNDLNPATISIPPNNARQGSSANSGLTQTQQPNSMTGSPEVSSGCCIIT